VTWALFAAIIPALNRHDYIPTTVGALWDSDIGLFELEKRAERLIHTGLLSPVVPIKLQGPDKRAGFSGTGPHSVPNLSGVGSGIATARELT
jgi:hypothetical protein